MFSKTRNLNLPISICMCSMYSLSYSLFIFYIQLLFNIINSTAIFHNSHFFRQETSFAGAKAVLEFAKSNLANYFRGLVTDDLWLLQAIFDSFTRIFIRPHARNRTLREWKIAFGNLIYLRKDQSIFLVYLYARSG